MTYILGPIFVTHSTAFKTVLTQYYDSSIGYHTGVLSFLTPFHFFYIIHNMCYEESIHSALYLSENIKSYIRSLFKEAVDTFVSKEMCIAPLLYLLQGSNHVYEMSSPTDF